MMKRFLSLMSCILVTSTTAIVAVSCDAATKKEYKQFESYVADSKDKTYVIYIGAKNNNSSISFEKGLQEVTDTTSLDSAINKINNTVSSDTNNFLYKFQSNLGWSKTNNNLKNLSDFDVIKRKGKNNKEYWVKTSNKAKQTLLTDERMQNSMVKFGAIVYNDIDDLWKNGITKKILTDYLVPNLAKEFYGLPNSDIKYLQVNENLNKLETTITQTKGPLFMVIRDGMFYGLINSFETFVGQSNNAQDASKAVDNTTDQQEAKKIRSQTYDKWIDYLKNVIEKYNIQSNNQSSITYQAKWQNPEDGKNNKK